MEKQPPPPPPATTAGVAAATAIHSPPSSTSSPSHEFSFTISLHPQPTTKLQSRHHNFDHHKSTTKSPTHTPPPPPPPFSAIDLSPADDIFFHGHLLPLHLLSHLPVSPRSSTNSLDSFTLPIKDLLDDQNDPNSSSFRQISSSNNINTSETKNSRIKSKSFSLFGLPKWRKGSENREKEDTKKISHVLKRYMKMVRPLLSSFRGSRRTNTEFQRQPYSFSGSLSSRRPEFRGEFSAPASMRTSPTNSGLLLATSGTVSPTSKSTTDSTMEELQAAIQAAIAHCKNSIAMEEKIK